ARRFGNRQADVASDAFRACTPHLPKRRPAPRRTGGRPRSERPPRRPGPQEGPIPRSRSRGASFTLPMSGLTRGHEVTVWFVIFNEPQTCTHGEGPYRCGPGDLPPFGGDDSAVRT